MGQGVEDGIEDLVEEVPVVAQTLALLGPDVPGFCGACEDRPVEGRVLHEAPLEVAEFLVVGVLGVDEAHRHERYLGFVSSADRQGPLAEAPAYLAAARASADDDGTRGCHQLRGIQEELVAVLERQVAPCQGGDGVAHSLDGIHAPTSTFA